MKTLRKTFFIFILLLCSMLQVEAYPSSNSGENVEYITMTCNICHGTGRAKQMCFRCAGLGFVLQMVPDYLIGFTHVQVRCPQCGGKGGAIVTCAKCSGRGVYSTPVFTPSYGNIDYNIGTGGYTGGYSGSGTTSSSGSSRITCSRCGGSGVCKSCGNTGGRWEYVDGYTGSGAKSFINCGECNGRRQCPICYGRGYL